LQKYALYTGNEPGTAAGYKSAYIASAREMAAIDPTAKAQAPQYVHAIETQGPYWGWCEEWARIG